MQYLDLYIYALILLLIAAHTQLNSNFSNGIYNTIKKTSQNDWSNVCNSKHNLLLI